MLLYNMKALSAKVKNMLLIVFFFVEIILATKSHSVGKPVLIVIKGAKSVRLCTSGRISRSAGGGSEHSPHAAFTPNGIRVSGASSFNVKSM